MTQYKVGDMFLSLDSAGSYLKSEEVVAFQITKKFKDKGVIVYRLKTVYLHHFNPNNWRLRQNEFCVTRYKLGSMLNNEEIKKMEASDAAKLLLTVGGDK